MSKHLVLRNSVYYARLDIPKDLRDHFGKTSFIRSLRTKNKRAAEIAAFQLIAQWKLEIEAARGNNALLQEARTIRSMVLNGRDFETVDAYKDYALEVAENLESTGEITPTEDGCYRTTKTDEAVKFYKVATGVYTPIQEYADTWLKDIAVKPKTQLEYERAIRDLSAHYEFVEEIDRRKAARFIREVLSFKRSSQTVNKKLSAYIGFWEWLERLGHIAESSSNPWKNQRPHKSRLETPFVERRAFTEEEATALLQLIKKTEARHVDDYCVSLLMAATGLRLSEATMLKVMDCDDVGETIWVTIREAKTKAGKRRVPLVHRELCNLFRSKLTGKEPSDYVFQILDSNSAALSKRLANNLRKLSSDKELVAAHSWRHRARTLAEHGGIEPWTADGFFGHKREGEGLGRYSKKPSDEQLLTCAYAIHLPKL